MNLKNIAVRRVEVFFYCLLFNLAFFSITKAQDRITSSLNSTWLFFKGDTADKTHSWAPVSIPHTWNAEDVMDDDPGYYRGDGWYKKLIYVPADWKEKDVYLTFEGVGQVAEVYINGKFVSKHIGGYTAFSFLLNEFLSYGKEENKANEVLVKVNNSGNPNRIPATAFDFNVYGGIYRDVYLKVLNRVHFDADNHASSGVFVTTPSVSNLNASVRIKGAFVNTDNIKKDLIIYHRIFDANGKLFREQKNNYRAAPGKKVSFLVDIQNIKGQHLWSIEDPYIYRVVSTITDASSNKKLDEVSNPLGFRWYSFDPEKGFYLNGRHVKLIGASRHQDFKGMGNALPEAIQIRDVELLKKMGGNFLRIAHYPQDPAVIQACDRLGILTSVETPVIGSVTETDEYTFTTKSQHLEMIRQNMNHPSLIMWSYMNEILLLVPYDKDSKEANEYFKKVTKLAQELEDICNQEDPQRYTIIPNHGAWDLYNRAGITKIPKLVGWNLYQGWYEGEFEDLGRFLDKHHKELPNKPILITEYGADADERLHSFNPVRFDKTIEYSKLYHQSSLKQIQDRPFVAGAFVWNLADFGSESRIEATPHINTKGLLTQDRKPKEAYLFYQANLLKAPFIAIGSKDWKTRTGVANISSAQACKQPISVYSNQKRVTLKHNGKEIGTIETVQGIAEFEVPFVHGENRLEASSVADDLQISDQCSINFKLLPPFLKNQQLNFDEINISVGDRRYLYDETTDQCWLPDQEYKNGSWGYVGGEPFAMKGHKRISYGTNKSIFGTELDPIYQTQQVGLKQYKLDVPDGDYEVTLHFAEIVAGKAVKDLIFNLGSGVNQEVAKSRSFDVFINDRKVLSSLGDNNYLLPGRAHIIKYHITVNSNLGITIDFGAIKGETILNGIQVKKVR